MRHLSEQQKPSGGKGRNSALILYNKVRSRLFRKQLLQQLFNRQVQESDSEPGAVYEALLSEIHKEIRIRPEPVQPNIIPLRLTIVKFAAAASILAMVVSGVLWFNKSKQPAELVHSTPPVNHPFYQTETNRTMKDRTIVLGDGSTVVLMPGAAVTYYQPFINHRRDISLQGSAFFNVAQDKTSPFTVYANNIATTAVGTQFYVYADHSNTVNVQLLEGKVIISSTPDARVTMKEVVLKPGEEFNLNKETLVMAVTRIARNSTGPVPELARKTGYHNGDMEFNKEPLVNVFRKLTRKYGTTIEFNQEEIQHTFFTGAFPESDSLNGILSVICSLKELKQTRHNNIIIISKIK